MSPEQAIVATSPRRTTLARQRQVAKWGMGTALATLLVTGLAGGKVLKNLHVATGLTLVGLALWHWQLNQPRRR